MKREERKFIASLKSRFNGSIKRLRIIYTMIQEEKKALQRIFEEGVKREIPEAGESYEDILYDCEILMDTLEEVLRSNVLK